MTTETLLDMAKGNLRYAKHNLEYMQNDKLYLNFIGYSLQQATEIALKQVYVLKEISFPYTHDIEKLLTVLKESTGIEFDYIFDYSDTITSWETKTRYLLDFKLSLNRINTILPYIERLMLDIEGMFKLYRTGNPIEKLRKLESEL